MNGDPLVSRLTLDYESICRDLEEIFEEIGRLCGDQSFVKVLGEKNIQAIKEKKDTIRRRLRGDFQLVVVGDFKRGKSTLINAFLGENIVPTAVTPETVTINKLSYSEVPRLEAVLKNRKRVSLSQAELRRETLDQMIKELPSPIECIDIRLNHQRLRDMTIVDTPGMGDLLRAFDEQVANYLINADAIIYVVSARAPLSYAEQAFLSTSIIPQSFSRVFLAINMADTLETKENLKKVETLVKSRAQTISDKIYVYLVSALDEYCRKCGMERPEPELAEALENNFLEFESAIQNDIVLQKDIIKSTRGIALTRYLLGEIVSRIGLIQSSLTAEAECLERDESTVKEQDATLHARIERHKETLIASVSQMAVEAKDWMRSFLARMEQEIREMGADTDISDLQRYFQFYLIDLIKHAILACTQKHQKEIGDLLLDHAKTISGEISQNAYGSIQTQISDCITDISWTDVDSAMFVGDVFLSMSGLGAALGPLVTVGQAIAGVVRKKTLAKKQTDVTDPILNMFPTIVSGVLENIDQTYALIEKKALRQLDEIYQNQIEVSEEAMKQAHKIASDKNVKMQDVLDYLEDILHTIQSYTHRLDECV